MDGAHEPERDDAEAVGAVGHVLGQAEEVERGQRDGGAVARQGADEAADEAGNGDEEPLQRHPHPLPSWKAGAILPSRPERVPRRYCRSFIARCERHAAVVYLLDEAGGIYLRRVGRRIHFGHVRRRLLRRSGGCSRAPLRGLGPARAHRHQTCYQLERRRGPGVSQVSHPSILYSNRFRSHGRLCFHTRLIHRTPGRLAYSEVRLENCRRLVWQPRKTIGCDSFSQLVLLTSTSSMRSGGPFTEISMIFPNPAA
jgi:hypothetical protein